MYLRDLHKLSQLLRVLYTGALSTLRALSRASAVIETTGLTLAREREREREKEREDNFPSKFAISSPSAPD